MQLSASALFFGLITGLLGVWLFLWSAERQHADYRVQESRVACDKARFDTQFANNFGKAAPEVLEREKAACRDFDAQVSQRAIAEEKAKKEAEQLKKSIEQALTSEQAQAEMQAAAASGVSATMKATVTGIKK